MKRDKLIKLVKIYDLDYVVHSSKNNSIRVKGNKKDFILALKEDYSSDCSIDNVVVDSSNSLIVVG